MAKKFVKALGLHNIFNATSATELDITSIKTEVADRVNSNSIVFITADNGDVQYGYINGSKYIWTCNELYPTNESQITLNNVTTASASFYAPTTSGSNGQFLMSTGSGAPIWTTVSDEKVKLNQSTSSSNIPLLAAPISNPSNGSTYESAFSNNIVLNPNTITLVVGENCENAGTYGITEGYYTRTINMAEHAQGAMNLSHAETGEFDGNPRNTVHSIGIGIGEAESNRKNAVEVMQNGDTYIKGIGNYDGTDFNKSTNILPIQQCMVQSSDVLRIWQGTQIEYDNLPIKYSNTLYLIKDDSEEVEYVDLGLSSGNLWAKYNLGASYSETNVDKWYGGYFAWGETEPRQSFTEAEYKYGDVQDNILKFTKYCNDESIGINDEYTDNLTELLPEDDAAIPVLGNGTEMPTDTDFIELYNEISAMPVQDYQGISGLNGLLFEGNGEELFIPAAGYYDESGINGDGISVLCWTKTLVTDGCDKAWTYNSDAGECQPMFRHYGMPIRAIKRQN